MSVSARREQVRASYGRFGTRAESGRSRCRQRTSERSSMACTRRWPVGTGCGSRRCSRFLRVGLGTMNCTPTLNARHVGTHPRPLHRRRGAIAVRVAVNADRLRIRVWAAMGRPSSRRLNTGTQDDLVNIRLQIGPAPGDQPVVRQTHLRAAAPNRTGSHLSGTSGQAISASIRAR